MPLYSYECSECGKLQDRILKLAEIWKAIKCQECGGSTKKVITLGHGGIQRDEPTWLPDACEQLIPEGQKPFETRTEYKKYLKDKNLIAAG